MSDQLGVLRGDVLCHSSRLQIVKPGCPLGLTYLGPPPQALGKVLPVSCLLGSQAQVSPCSASSSKLASPAGELEADLSYKGVCFNLVYLCRVSHGVLLSGLVGAAGLSLSTAPSTALQAAAYVRA